MISLLLSLAAWMQASEPGQTAFQLQRRNHTIYVLRGTADQLKRFQSEVGSTWKGGVLLEARSGPLEFQYWANAERTAGQARQFILGSMLSGVQVDVKVYDESAFYPAERAALNEIVSSCDLPADPFFITPQREIVIEKAEGEAKCATPKLDAAESLKGLQRSYWSVEQKN